MNTFGFIPVEAAIQIPHLRNPFIRLVKQVADACNLQQDFKGMLLMLAKPNICGEVALKTFGLYVLFKDSDIVAMALMGNMNHVDAIYVPEQYRKKGYAVELLKHISDLYKSDFKIPVFSPVASHAEKTFEKAGWVRVGTGAKDGTYDYTPAQCIETYKTMKTFKRESSEKQWDVFQTWSMRHLMPMMSALKKMKK